jgi:hypothetical protein
MKQRDDFKANAEVEIKDNSEENSVAIDDASENGEEGGVATTTFERTPAYLKTLRILSMFLEVYPNQEFADACYEKLNEENEVIVVDFIRQSAGRSTDKEVLPFLRDPHLRPKTILDMCSLKRGQEWTIYSYKAHKAMVSKK